MPGLQLAEIHTFRVGKSLKALSTYNPLLYTRQTGVMEEWNKRKAEQAHSALPHVQYCARVPKICLAFDAVSTDRLDFDLHTSSV